MPIVPAFLPAPPPVPALPSYRPFGGRLCLDFVNTVNGRLTNGPEDLLAEAGALVAWGQQLGLLEAAAAVRIGAAWRTTDAVAAARLAQAVALRETLYAVFAAIATGGVPARADLDTLSDAYRAALASARLVAAGDGGPWRWEPHRAAAEPADLGWLVWPVTRSAIDLLTSDDLAGLKRCAGADRGCAGLFVDETRNGIRRWCSMDGCGSRAKMRRLYARRRADRGASA